MNLRKILRDNFVLALGIFVPVLLMGGFFIATSLTKHVALGHADLHYDILFSGDYPLNRSPLNAMVFVDHNALYVQYSREQPGNFGTIPMLYIYEAATNKLRQLDFPPPDASDDSILGKNILVESAKSLNIDASPTSPDGFQFYYGTDAELQGGGILDGLFIGGAYGTYGPRLKKGNNSFPLALPGNEYANQLHLIGWVVK